MSGVSLLPSRCSVMLATVNSWDTTGIRFCRSYNISRECRLATEHKCARVPSCWHKRCIYRSQLRCSWDEPGSSMMTAWTLLLVLCKQWRVGIITTCSTAACVVSYMADRSVRSDLHAILQCAEDTRQTHHLAPMPAQAQQTASSRQHRIVCSVVAVQAACHAPCKHTSAISRLCRAVPACLRFFDSPT